MLLNNVLSYAYLFVLGVILYLALFFFLEILAYKSSFFKKVKNILTEDDSSFKWRSSFIILCFGCILGLFLTGFDLLFTNNFSLNRSYTIFGLTVIITFLSMH